MSASAKQESQKSEQLTNSREKNVSSKLRKSSMRSIPGEKVSKLRVALVFAIPVLVGIAVAIPVMLDVYRSEHRVREQLFVDTAIRVESNIAEIVSNQLIVLALLARALESTNGTVTATYFATLAEEVNKKEPIKALEYLPYVPHSEREEFELSATAFWQSKLGTDSQYSITQQTKTSLSERETADFYYPVKFVEPAASNELDILLDRMSTDVAAQAFLAAAESRNVSISSAITVLDPTYQRNEKAVLVVSSIHLESQVHYVLEVVLIRSLFESLTTTIPHGLKFTVWDVSHSDTETLLGVYGTGVSQDSEMEASHSLEYDHNILIGDTEWKFKISDSGEFFPVNAGPTVGLGLTVILTFVLVGAGSVFVLNSSTNLESKAQKNIISKLPQYTPVWSHTFNTLSVLKASIETLGKQEKPLEDSAYGVQVDQVQHQLDDLVLLLELVDSIVTSKSKQPPSEIEVMNNLFKPLCEQLSAVYNKDIVICQNASKELKLQVQPRKVIQAVKYTCILLAHYAEVDTLRIEPELLECFMIDVLHIKFTWDHFEIVCDENATGEVADIDVDSTAPLKAALLGANRLLESLGMDFEFFETHQNLENVRSVSLSIKLHDSSANLLPVMDTKNICVKWTLLDMWRQGLQFASTGTSNVNSGPTKVVSSTPITRQKLESILILDGNLLFMKTFEAKLKDALPTLKVHCAHEEATLPKLLSKNTYQLVVVDSEGIASAVSQESKTGTETVKLLRAEGYNGEICATSSRDNAEPFLLAGANYFLLKPYLIEAIQDCAANRQSSNP